MQKSVACDTRKSVSLSLYMKLLLLLLLLLLLGGRTPKKMLAPKTKYVENPRQKQNSVRLTQ